MERSKFGIFWFGVVEDREDPLQSGRVRVRIFGYHSPLKSDIPTEDLYWAQVSTPTTSPSTSGVGTTSSLVPGSWVMGMWMDDGEGYQHPIVIASVPGVVPKEDKSDGMDPLQEGLKENKTVENFGDGFRDPRTEEQLKKEPTSKFKKKEYPDGKDKKGDERGAQIENDQAEKFPRRASNSCINFTDGTMSDMSVIATNDEKYIDNTIIGYKRTPREKGGLLDDGIKIANIEMKPFKCGVTNESKVNKGTKKKLGIGDNSIESTWIPSTFENYAVVKEKPTNSDGQLVYKTEKYIVGGKFNEETGQLEGGVETDSTRTRALSGKPEDQAVVDRIAKLRRDMEVGGSQGGTGRR